jgi:tetratricopeptide (TPR) repeat protein
MPPKGKRKSKQKIEIKESRGFVIGDFATVINNFWDEKILKRFGLEQRAGFLILFVAIVGVGVGLYFALRTVQPETMSGDFRIAVAGFYEDGKSPVKNLGYDLAENVRLRLEQDVKEIDPELVIRIWGPDQVGGITGTTSDQRAKQAEKIAMDIHADMVVYGVVDLTTEKWQVLPVFYISAENFYEAREIVGQNDLGTPFDLPSASNTAWRTEFGRKMFARGKALSIMSVGLGYFALHEYDKALETFQSGSDIPNWDDDQGKKVLYMMTAFAAGKAGERKAQDETLEKEKALEEAGKYFDLSEDLLKKALSIDPEYARPLIGLANLSYMRAVQPFNQSKKPQDTDIRLLEECHSYLDQAQSATNKPPLADAETKIHFARGQCLFMEVYSGHGNTTNLAPVINEFETVISDYGDGKNPRIKELAAEAHARMALIYRLIGENDKAIQEYDIAIDLLSNYPERQKIFLDRRANILEIIATP